MVLRAAMASKASPGFPPTPIQFSGAHSRKSNASAGASCSAPSRARRRPRPVLALASPAVIDVTGSHRAALALAALAFHRGLVAALGVVVGLHFLGADEAVVVRIVGTELVVLAVVGG